MCVPCFSCCSAYRIIVVVNVLIALFGVIAIGIGSYSIYTYSGAEDDVGGDSSSFFSKQTYALMIFGGIMSFFSAALAIAGGKDPKARPNFLFCYWCILSVVLVVNAVAFYYFRTFILSIDRSASIDTTREKILNLVEVEFAKEFQDYILSTYTACCSGCDSAIPELNCVNGGINNTETLENCYSGGATCDFARHCTFEELQDGNHGLGHACYTSSAKEVPGFDVGLDTCATLSELTLDDEPLVGPATNGKSCGGGDPSRYVKRFNEYFESRYFLVAVPWGFSIVLEGLAWLAAVYLIMCPYDPTEHKN